MSNAMKGATFQKLALTGAVGLCLIGSFVFIHDWRKTASVEELVKATERGISEAGNSLCSSCPLNTSAAPIASAVQPATTSASAAWATPRYTIREDQAGGKLQYFEGKMLRATDVLDEGGRLARRDFYDDGNRLRARQYYSPAGREVASERFDASGKLLKRHMFMPMGGVRSGY
jgi:hypothetical protein